MFWEVLAIYFCILGLEVDRCLSLYEGTETRPNHPGGASQLDVPRIDSIGGGPEVTPDQMTTPLQPAPFIVKEQWLLSKLLEE